MGLTDEERQRVGEIAERASKAKHGPWEVQAGPDESFIGPWSGKREHEYDGGLPIVDVRLFSYGRKWPSRETRLEDAWFVAQAREDVPWLLDLVARLAKEQ